MLIIMKINIIVIVPLYTMASNTSLTFRARASGKTVVDQNIYMSYHITLKQYMLDNIKQLTGIFRDLRKSKRMSQLALAGKVGIPQSHLSRIETGNVNIKLASFVEIARTLDLEVMLVPTQDAETIKRLITSKAAERHGDEIRPAYTLDDE